MRSLGEEVTLELVKRNALLTEARTERDAANKRAEKAEGVVRAVRELVAPEWFVISIAFRGEGEPVTHVNGRTDTQRLEAIAKLVAEADEPVCGTCSGTGWATDGPCHGCNPPRTKPEPVNWVTCTCTPRGQAVTGHDDGCPAKPEPVRDEPAACLCPAPAGCPDDAHDNSCPAYAKKPVRDERGTR